MSTAVEERTTWWGTGAPPHEHWPGVTIPIDDCGGKYRFDAGLADRVCAFFPRFCSHSKGQRFAGKPFEPLDYQLQLILRPLFGWVRNDDEGRRRFQKAYIQIPKKNGKTQLVAGLALYMLLADGEQGAEVYVAAADRSQARILFLAAKAMVEANPYLKKRCVIYSNQIVRADDPTAFFQVLSAEAATKHGPNIHCLIIDELHAQPDRDLFETLTRGIIARRQPLVLLITTAGNDDESICFEEYTYAKHVLSGTIEDERHLPVIFEAAPSDDWMEPAVWAKVNPGLGHTITVDAVAGFALEAANEPRKQNDFFRYNLNRWTNQATAWITTDAWDANNAPLPSDDELKLLPCAAGLDMAQKWDLTCFSVVFRIALPETITAEVVTGDVVPEKRSVNLNYRIVMVPFFWIPEDTMRQHEKEDRVPYARWVELGLVTATEGATIDYNRVHQDITTKILPRFPRLKQSTIGYDPAFATDIATNLNTFMGRKDWCVEVLQNYTHLSEVAHIFEALVKANRVCHGGHRVLRNHIENVAVKTDDAGRIRPVKPKRVGKHIDGVVAGLMGLKRLATVPDLKSSLQIHFLGARA